MWGNRRPGMCLRNLANFEAEQVLPIVKAHRKFHVIRANQVLFIEAQHESGLSMGQGSARVRDQHTGVTKKS